MDCPTIFHDAQPTRREVFRDAMVEHDDAVGDVLLQSLPRYAAIASLAGNDRRNALVLEPAKEAPEFGAQNRFIRQPAEQRFESVQGNPFCADRVDRVTEAYKEPFEVVFTGFFDLAAFDMDIVDQHLLARRQVVEIEAKRPHVLGQLWRGLLESNETARLVEFSGTTDE